MPMTPMIPMVPGDEPQTSKRTDSQRRQEETIRSRILDSAGMPSQLYRVAVIPLWRNHFRVNVLTGADATSVRIANSYFVVSDDGGNIVRASPTIRQGPEPGSPRRHHEE